jgi:hypothetical protein
MRINTLLPGSMTFFGNCASFPPSSIAVDDGVQFFFVCLKIYIRISWLKTFKITIPHYFGVLRKFPKNHPSLDRFQGNLLSATSEKM